MGLQRKSLLIVFVLLTSCVFSRGFCNEEEGIRPSKDWPMWRYDAGRTAVTPNAFPSTLHLQWTLRQPPLRPAFRNERLHFDAGYEPIVMGNTMLVGSSVNDSVTAYDTHTGTLRWKFFTEGPVRVAPAGWQNRIFVGSDDGHLYCLEVATGKLVWKFRAVPSTRKILGNGRLISVWPVRGGPVVADRCVYFAAGVWPFEGVFVYALDVETGKLVWRNDRLGYLYGQHPHDAKAMGGLAPQGYLIVNGDQLVVPCGSAYPATLNRNTGTLISFELPKPGRQPGGWFAALDKKTAQDVRRGKIVYDRGINQQQHEDKVYVGQGLPDVRATMTAAGKTMQYDARLPGLAGTIYSMLAADERLFVVTREGDIYCYGSNAVSAPAVHSATVEKPAAPTDQHVDQIKHLLESAGTRNGYALVWGLTDGNLIEALVQTTDLHVIGVHPDEKKVSGLRQRFESAGVYGTRVHLITAGFGECGFPPYFATLVTSEHSKDWLSSAPSILPQAFDCLRPHGGTITIASEKSTFRKLAASVSLMEADNAAVTFSGGHTVIKRVGALPGGANYLGGWRTSEDTAVRAPVGVLWFDDTLGHFKRSPQPTFVDGVMISFPKNWKYPRGSGAEGDYPLLSPVLSDVYTGRVLADDEHVALRETLPKPDPEKREPPQYRPPTQTDDWKPEAPRPGNRTNPLTLQEEPRTFPKSYGCDGGFDYGCLFTMRSGTAAFYDKTNDSGTIHISGPRSGCTNSIVPACGVLNVPYFYEGCTCSYPLPTGLALASMPETFEQWATWGRSTPDAIQRIGINFGAPGDRVTRGGTLWLDFPNVGGPSPEITANAQPETARYFYQHSVFVELVSGWPWVAASGVEGMTSFSLDKMKPGSYTVRLYFSERGGRSKGERVQTISLQGKTVLRDFDILEAVSEQQSLFREFQDIDIDGQLKLQLSAQHGTTRICGIELIRSSED